MKVQHKFSVDKIIPAKQDFAVLQPFQKPLQPSFKGSLTYLELAEKFGEDFGKAAGENFRAIIEKVKDKPYSGLKIDSNQTITFKKETYLERAFDILLYPVTQMPLDIVNMTISGLKKIPGFKDASWLEALANKRIFKNRKEVVETKSHVSAIQHYFEVLTGNSEGGEYKRFVEGHKRLAPLMPNYNSETERSLNRIVTGMIPAFFLANDAYNLSMYMKNDKKAAEKEKKRRFNQEVIRIGITSAVTFAAMKSFAKQCNKSMNLTASITLGIVLISEVMGRLMAGNPVLPVTAKGAKKYADKRKDIQQSDTSKPAQQENTGKNPAKKGFLTVSNILKTIVGLIVFGFAAEKISKFPKVSEKLKCYTEKYKKLFTEDFIISREKYFKITQKLRDNGFDVMAQKYEAFVGPNESENIKIGSIKNKTKYVLIHQILTFPVRFVRDVVMFPYEKAVKPLVKIIKKESKEEKEINFKERLQDSIKFLEKIQNDEPENFTRKVNEKIISSFDNLTKSSYKNSDLGVIVKNAQSALTSAFLIADNYNMVMIDSQGKDKDLAEQKAKERTMQRASRLTYEAFILKMVNDIFAGPYNSSLLAALSIAGILRVITEVVERKSVGLPLNEATQDEIRNNEKEHLQATGLKGSYFRAMAKVTGKKTFAENEKNTKKS